MKVRELQSLLSPCHPDEDLVLYSISGRYMTILGLNAEKSAEIGFPVLDVDWTISKVRPVEDARDVLLRQQEAIERAIEMIDREAAAPKKSGVKSRKRKKGKRKRTPAEQLENGTIPTGKRGRPRKIVTEADLGLKPQTPVED